MPTLIIVFGVLALVILIVIAKSIVVIRQAETVIVERLGKFHKRLDAGVRLIMPIFDRIRKIRWKSMREYNGKVYPVLTELERIDLREIVYDFPRQNVITKDNVTIEINAMLYFQILDPYKAVYEIENFPDAIEKLTQTTLRNVIGELELDQTLSSRDVINARLREILDDATDKWGVKVNRVELQDIVPPKDIKEAMEKQMRAEREKREMILRSEGEKQSAILRAEGVKISRITEAEGEKQNAILRAEGEATARIKIAEAESLALQKVGEVMKNSDPSQYLIAIKYVEALKNIAETNDNRIVFMPFESSSVIGALGGIKELLADVGKKKDFKL